MNNIYSILICFFLLLPILSGQIFYSEDFESYNSNDLITQVSSDWKVEVNDAAVVDDKAHDGEKSLFFETNTDVTLLLQDRYTTGSFAFGCSFYLDFTSLSPSDFPGFYFGFGDEFDFYGLINLTHISYQNFMLTYDPHRHDRARYQNDYELTGKWIDYKVEVDLDNNEWNYYLDGECISSISNRVTTISELYFWGTAINMWVDDIYYEYHPQMLNNDYSLDANIDYGDYRYHGIVGNAFPQLGTVYNNGQTDIENIELEFEYGDDVYYIFIDNLNLSPGESKLIVPNNPIYFKEGIEKTSLTLLNVNGRPDVFECNNNFGQFARGYVVHPDKKVLVESLTNMNCGLCLENIYFKELLESEYADQMVGLEIHYGDTLAHEAFANEMGFFYENLLDRKGPFYIAGQIGGFGSQEFFLERLAVPPSAKFSIKANFVQSNIVDINIEVEALEDVSKIREIFAAIKEKEVTGNSATFNQSNDYFSGWGMGTFGGYELLPPVIPYTDMVYKDIPRALLTDKDGDRLLQNDLKAGEKANLNFEYVVPEGQAIDDLYVVVSISDKFKFISNAEEASFQELGIILVDNDGDGFTSDQDCDDNNPAVFPGAMETCNNLDDNCNGKVDEDIALINYYLDNDGDGFGNENTLIQDCEALNGYVLLAGDCDDNDPSVFPDAEEIPNNGIDENCDGIDLTTATHELSESKISIYPNPAIDKLIVDFKDPLKIICSIYNMNGGLVFTIKNSKYLDLESLSSGIYVLIVEDLVTNERIVERIIVNK